MSDLVLTTDDGLSGKGGFFRAFVVALLEVASFAAAPPIARLCTNVLVLFFFESSSTEEEEEKAPKADALVLTVAAALLPLLLLLLAFPPKVELWGRWKGRLEVTAVAVAADAAAGVLLTALFFANGFSTTDFASSSFGGSKVLSGNDLDSGSVER